MTSPFTFAAARDSLAIWKAPDITDSSVHKNLNKIMRVRRLVVFIATSVFTAIVASRIIPVYRTTHLMPLYASLGVQMGSTAKESFRSFDTKRAEEKIDTLLADYFKKGKTEKDKESHLTYLANRPAAIKRLFEGDNKVSPTHPDLQQLLHLTDKNRLPRSPICSFEAFKTLIDSGVKIEKDLLIGSQEKKRVLRGEQGNYLSWHPHWALYALEKGAIDLSSLSIKEQWTLLTFNDIRFKKALIDRGVDIDLQSDGLTPLAELILSSSSQLKYPLGEMLSLIALGATVPDREDPQFSASQAAFDLLDNFSSDAPIGSLKLEEAEPYHFFNLQKPAITIGGEFQFFKVNATSIFNRSFVSSIPAFITAPLLLVFAPTYLPVLALYMAGVLAQHKYSWLKAEEALTERATKEFANRFPSEAVVEYVLENESALDYLIEKGVDFHKMVLDRYNKSIFELALETSNQRSLEKLANAPFIAKAPQYYLDACSNEKHKAIREIIAKKYFPQVA